MSVPVLWQCQQCHRPWQQLQLLSLNTETPECPCTGETWVLAPCVTVPAGHGSSLHLHTWSATISQSRDSAHVGPGGPCVSPGGPTGLSQAGGGLGLLLAMAGCHGITSVLDPGDARAWGAHDCPQLPERTPGLAWK